MLDQGSDICVEAAVIHHLGYFMGKQRELVRLGDHQVVQQIQQMDPHLAFTPAVRMQLVRHHTSTGCGGARQIDLAHGQTGGVQGIPLRILAGCS